MAGGLKVTLHKGLRDGRENPPVAITMPGLRQVVRKTHAPPIQKEGKGV